MSPPPSAPSETSTVMKESEAEGSSDARHRSRPTSTADVTGPLFFLFAAVLAPHLAPVFESDHIDNIGRALYTAVLFRWSLDESREGGESEVSGRERDTWEELAEDKACCSQSAR